jgi:hypothetical protein
MRKTLPLLLGAAAFLTACGSDSTGPGSLDNASALQSLALGLQAVGGLGSPTTPEGLATFGGIAPLLDQVTITIDGTAQGMYALGLRESFPDGTCEETLFVDPAFPPQEGVCTPPALGTVVILWETSSASRAPDKMLLIVADPGTSNFDFASAGDKLPAVALYTNGTDKAWISESGTLTSVVAATNQNCNAPLPPYAKTGQCTFATFSEQGSILLSPFTPTLPSTETASIVIPATVLHGIWLQITEVQATPLASLGQRLLRSLIKQ